MQWCNRCNTAFVRMLHSGDFVHECNSGVSELDNESIVVKGTWTDYTGSGGQPSASALLAGIPNKLMGTEESLLVHENDVNVHGDSAQTHRLRQHLETNEFDDNNKNEG